MRTQARSGTDERTPHPAHPGGTPASPGDPDKDTRGAWTARWAHLSARPGVAPPPGPLPKPQRPPAGPRRSQRSREAPPRRPRARARSEGRRHFRLRARRPPPLSPRTARRPADFIPRPLHSPATPSPRARRPPGLTRGPLGPPRAHLSARPSVCLPARPPAPRLRGSATPRLRSAAGQPADALLSRGCASGTPGGDGGGGGSGGGSGRRRGSGTGRGSGGAHAHARSRTHPHRRARPRKDVGSGGSQSETREAARAPRALGRGSAHPGAESQVTTLEPRPQNCGWSLLCGAGSARCQAVARPAVGAQGALRRAGRCCGELHGRRGAGTCLEAEFAAVYVRWRKRNCHQKAQKGTGER